MLPAERRRQILNLLKENHSIQVSDLSKKFSVSEGTIRRDLNILEKKGLLERTYGGATLNRGTGYDPPFELQKETLVAEKKKIGKAAAALVQNGDTLFIDSSSTNIYLVRALDPRENVTVVTNGIGICYELMFQPEKKIIVTGGTLRTRTASLLGKLSEAVLDELYVDKAFLGVSACSLARGMSTATIAEAELKRAAIRAAKEVYAVTDSSKFGHDKFAFVAEFSEFDGVITDEKVPEEFRNTFSEEGIRLIVADK